MAEYADEAIERMLFGVPRSRRRGRDRIAKCDRCGGTDVYWSQNGQGEWRLYEEGKRDTVRGQLKLPKDNRKMLHSCSQATADDFEGVE